MHIILYAVRMAPTTTPPSQTTETTPYPHSSPSSTTKYTTPKKYQLKICVFSCSVLQVRGIDCFIHVSPEFITLTIAVTGIVTPTPTNYRYIHSA